MAPILLFLFCILFVCLFVCLCVCVCSGGGTVQRDMWLAMLRTWRRQLLPSQLCCGLHRAWTSGLYGMFICLSVSLCVSPSVRCVSLHLSRPSCPSAPLSFRLERSNPDHQASSSVKSFCLIESTGLMFNNKNGIYVTEVPEKNVKKLSAVENWWNI